jgi:DNA-directed RNA polymerase specialized sigma24 family protein
MSEKDSTRPPDRESEQRAWLKENIDAEALRGLVHRQIRDPHAAYDIVQNWLDFMAKKPMSELKGIGSPMPYARCAVLNRTKNWRRDNRKFATSTADPTVPTIFESPEVEISGEEETLEFIGMLPDELIEPFVICKIHGYTSKEAALKLGLSESLVKKRVSKAVKFLKPHFPEPRRRSLRSRIRGLFRRKESKK